MFELILAIIALVFVVGLIKFRSHKKRLERLEGFRQERERQLNAAKHWWNTLSDEDKEANIEAYHIERERREQEQAEYEAWQAEENARLEQERQHRVVAAAIVKQQKQSVRSSSVSTPHTPWQMPRSNSTPTPRQPRETNKYYVERMGPGQYKYEKLTGGDSNLRNAHRRMDQHKDARYGTDSKHNASEAKYRIVDKDGRVQ